jgi:hypothetical protein
MSTEDSFHQKHHKLFWSSDASRPVTDFLDDKSRAALSATSVDHQNWFYHKGGAIIKGQRLDQLQQRLLAETSDHLAMSQQIRGQLDRVDASLDALLSERAALEQQEQFHTRAWTAKIKQAADFGARN